MRADAPTGMEHSMATTELKASARSGVGKGAARALRRQGLVPAVIYGNKEAPLPIALGFNETNRRIYAGGFLSHIITLDVDGTKHRVIPRDYHLDPVSDKPLHVDFLRVGADSRLNVEVHVAIPEQIEVDLTGAQIGDSLHISAVKLPKGIEPTIHDRDFTIATIVAPSGLKSEDAAAGTEAE
jgi:large subunit ribosomal protein L25